MESGLTDSLRPQSSSWISKGIEGGRRFLTVYSGLRFANAMSLPDCVKIELGGVDEPFL